MFKDIRLYKRIDIEQCNNFFRNNINIVTQKTGYGVKRFLECPLCGSKRVYLYLDQHIGCRKCLKLTYITQNIYDENILDMIKYKIINLLLELKVDIFEKDTYGLYKLDMLSLTGNNFEKPKYMRWEVYALIIKKIHFLMWMYWEKLGGKRDFTVREINQMLDKENVEFAWDVFLYNYFHKVSH